MLMREKPCLIPILLMARVGSKKRTIPAVGYEYDMRDCDDYYEE